MKKKGKKGMEGKRVGEGVGERGRKVDAMTYPPPMSRTSRNPFGLNFHDINTTLWRQNFIAPGPTSTTLTVQISHSTLV